MSGPLPVIDGVVYGFQRYGGINTLFNEVLPRVAARYAPVTIFLPRHPAGPTPRGRRVRRLPRELLPEEVPLGPATPRWRALADRVNTRFRDARLLAMPGAVFQSTYFTTTSVCRSVAMVYDLNHELYADLYTDPLQVRLRRVYAESVAGAARVIAISAKSKADAVKIYAVPPDRVDVVHLATNPGVFYPDPDPCPAVARVLEQVGGRPYVLYVGGRMSYKNFDLFLDALALPGTRGRVAGVVAGHRWTPAERVALTTRGLDREVVLVPTPPDDVLRRLYTRAAAFVYPSWSEGFGIPLLEAMNCGVPVIAADTPVFREVAGEAAEFVPHTDPAALTGALDRVRASGERDRLRAAGFRRAADFSWDRAAAGFWSSYQRAFTQS